MFEWGVIRMDCNRAGVLHNGLVVGITALLRKLRLET